MCVQVQEADKERAKERAIEVNNTSVSVGEERKRRGRKEKEQQRDRGRGRESGKAFVWARRASFQPQAGHPTEHAQTVVHGDHDDVPVDRKSVV